MFLDMGYKESTIIILSEWEGAQNLADICPPSFETLVVGS